ncbi:MAG: TetR/AcrR family transcriptional regulator [Oscillospiraceae bacterium]
MNTKGDQNRNVRRTKQRIRQAFITLAQDKPFARITVQEITALADINRSTFYLHYCDIFDLVDQLEQELLDQIVGALSQIRRDGHVEGEYPYHRAAYDILEQNMDVCAVLLGKNGDIRFLWRMYDILYRACCETWGNMLDGQPPEALRGYAANLVGGEIGMYLQNLWGVAALTAPEMASISGEYAEFADGRLRKLQNFDEQKII